VADESPQGIYVLAGTNGAGKSSVIGRALDMADTTWINPDLMTRELMEADPGLTLGQANALAWQEMVDRLRRAIDERLFFAFETTLGGSTIMGLLQDAALLGIDVRILYVGLATPELHILRVRARVAEGGHDIPEEKIRERYDSGRVHLIELLPFAKEVWLYDNSQETGVAAGGWPEPTLILHVRDQRIEAACALAEIPAWARPVVMSALDMHQN
jgi:predicted ABC-type ATPase